MTNLPEQSSADEREPVAVLREKLRAQLPADKGAVWLIRKGGYFYRPNKSGYTGEKPAAGRYTEADAKAEAAIEPDNMSAHLASEFPDPPMSISVEDARVLLDALEAQAAEIAELERRLEEAQRPMMWCLSCGSLTKDSECDCTTFDDTAGQQRLVLYEEELRKEAREAHARATALSAEVERAREALDGIDTAITSGVFENGKAVHRLKRPDGSWIEGEAVDLCRHAFIAIRDLARRARTRLEGSKI